MALEADVLNMFAAVEQKYGTVTHLVNNAGILFTQSTLADLSVQRFNQVLTTNVTSCFLCCREAIRQRNIRVNAVRPGFIHTDMHADGGEPNRIERLSPKIPLQRGGTANEVANAIAWLLSEQASYVTGTFIDIAGGK